MPGSKSLVPCPESSPASRSRTIAVPVFICEVPRARRLYAQFHGSGLTAAVTLALLLVALEWPQAVCRDLEQLVGLGEAFERSFDGRRVLLPLLVLDIAKPDGVSVACTHMGSEIYKLLWRSGEPGSCSWYLPKVCKRTARYSSESKELRVLVTRYSPSLARVTPSSGRPLFGQIPDRIERSIVHSPRAFSCRN